MKIDNWIAAKQRIFSRPFLHHCCCENYLKIELHRCLEKVVTYPCKKCTLLFPCRRRRPLELHRDHKKGDTYGSEGTSLFLVVWKNKLIITFQQPNRPTWEVLATEEFPFISLPQLLQFGWNVDFQCANRKIFREDKHHWATWHSFRMS